MAKPKGSTKSANKQQVSKCRKYPHGNGTKGPAKKGGHNRKWAVSNGSNEDSSCEELDQSCAQPKKKVRKQGIKEDGGDETEAEEVEESKDEDKAIKEVEGDKEDSDKVCHQ
jgi:hypothetical protein